MSQNTSPVKIPGDCEAVSSRLTQGLKDVGYQVIRSFDLQRARAVHIDCACPHHGNTECSCQMIVLLIYLPDGKPHTLIAHGRDGVTRLGWDETLSEEEESALFAVVKDVFVQVKQAGKNEIPANT